MIKVFDFLPKNVYICTKDIKQRIMTKATISYYGHSCFKVEALGSSIVFDPYEDGSVPGIKLPRDIKADAVSCSHQHGDHNAAHLIDVTGKLLNFDVKKITVPHDHHNGAHRGLSDITFLNLPGLTIVHLGDLGRLPTDEEYKKLNTADVILIPCAGYFTITSKEANEIISHLKHPSLKILMHFRDGNRGYDVQESINDIQKDIKNVKRLHETEITVDSDNIPDEIITLEPKQ